MKIFCFFAALLLAAGVSTAQAQPMAERIETVINSDPLSESCHVAVVVQELDSGDIVVDRQGSFLFTPASNMKLYTSGAAMDLLGPDYRFSTTIGVTAEPVDGVVDGDFVIRAGGDPVLTSDQLRALAQRAAIELEVHRITGDLVLDTSLFSAPLKGPGWMWDDEPYNFSMSITPLMMDYNTTEVVVEPGTEGEPASARLNPKAYSPIILNTVQTGPADADSSVRISREPFEDSFRAEGVIPEGGSAVVRSYSVLHPHEWIRSAFRVMLKEGGVHIDGAFVESSTAVTMTRSISHESEPLRTVISLFNKPSENAIGELLFLWLAIDAEGRADSWGNGERVLNEWLEGVAGLAPGRWRAADGSGLSRYNLITARGTVELLSYLWEQPYREDYMNSLPVAGIDGTLTSRMRGSPAEGKVYAKTGTMSGVSCLSGYAETADHGMVAFSILMNGFVGSSRPARDLQDQICEAIVMGMNEN